MPSTSRSSSTILLATGWLDVEQPLLFSPRVGDEVLVTHEVLAEVSRVGKNSPSSWRLVAAGTRGKLLGWRDPEGRGRDEIEAPKAVIDSRRRRAPARRVRIRA